MNTLFTFTALTMSLGITKMIAQKITKGPGSRINNILSPLTLDAFAEYDILDHWFIGLSAERNKLYFTRLSDDSEYEQVDLAQVAYCSAVVPHRNSIDGTFDGEMQVQLVLHMKHGVAPIVFSFYDHRIDRKPIDREIALVMKWRAILIEELAGCEA